MSYCCVFATKENKNKSISLLHTALLDFVNEALAEAEVIDGEISLSMEIRQELVLDYREKIKAVL